MKKIRYKSLFGFLLLSFPALILFSCSDKEDVITEAEKTDLVIEQEEIDIVVGDQAEVKIVSGNNNYRVFSLDESIASVSLVGNNLIINANQRGKTSVIISDASSQYRNLSIVSYYESIQLEYDEIYFKLPLGNIRTKSIDILQGNGSYVAESSNPEIVTVETSEESLIMTATKEGEVDVIITDDYGITKTVKVFVTTSTLPYDDDELEEIKQLDLLSYMYNGELVVNENSWYTMLNTVENGRNLYGWDYWGYMYLKIYFEGDKELGEKENASLMYKSWYSSVNVDSLDFEIIKNDGEKIWAIYYYIQDEKLYYGYFIQKINP